MHRVTATLIHPEEKPTSSKPLRAARSAGDDRSRRFYHPELDALRFFAFLCVFLHHTRSHSRVVTVTPVNVNGVSHGGGSLLVQLWKTFHFSLCSGVSLFFFLSAYLITTLLIMEREKTDTIHIGAFYVRRALRIWPLYFTYLLILLLLGLGIPVARMSTAEAFSTFGFYSNWYKILHPAQTAALAAMLWSISIEEQFYLLCPLGARMLKRTGMLISCGFALAGSCLLLYWLGAHGKFEDSYLRFNTFVQSLFLVGGALTALVIQKRDIRIPLVIRPLMLAAGLGTWLIAFLEFGTVSPLATFTTSQPLGHYVTGLVGVILIFFAFFGLDAKWIPRQVVYLGKISYGLYIWHILATWASEQVFGRTSASFALPMIALAVTIAISACSYRWLEKPFLSLKERFTFVVSRSA
jgi:peptidoglycan/LPS O-acetylase OafA/YrhL